MSELYNRIESLCKKRNINVTVMCKETGASRGSLTDLKAGRKKKIKYTTSHHFLLLYKIACKPRIYVI